MCCIKYPRLYAFSSRKSAQHEFFRFFQREKGVPPPVTPDQLATPSCHAIARSTTAEALAKAGHPTAVSTGPIGLMGPICPSRVTPHADMRLLSTSACHGTDLDEAGPIGPIRPVFPPVCHGVARRCNTQDEAPRVRPPLPHRSRRIAA